MSEIGQSDPNKSRIGSFGDFAAGFSAKIQTKKEPTLEPSDFDSSKTKNEEVIGKGLKSFGSLCKIVLLDVPTLGIGNVLGRLIGTGIRELQFPRNARIDKEEPFNLARALGKGIANPLRETREDLVATKALFREVGACIINAMTIGGNRYDSNELMTLDKGRQAIEQFREKGIDLAPVLQNSINNPEDPSVFYLMKQEDKVALLAELQPKETSLSPRGVTRSQSESTPLQRLPEPQRRMTTGDVPKADTPPRRKIAKATTSNLVKMHSRLPGVSHSPAQVKDESTYVRELEKIHEESKAEGQAPTEALARYLRKNRDDPKAVEVFIRHGIDAKVNFGSILEQGGDKIDKEGLRRQIEDMKRDKASMRRESESTLVSQGTEIAEVASKKPKKSDIYETMKQFYKDEDRMGLKKYVYGLPEAERRAVFAKIELKQSLIWDDKTEGYVDNPQKSKNQEAMWEWFNYNLDNPEDFK